MAHKTYGPKRQERFHKHVNSNVALLNLGTCKDSWFYLIAINLENFQTFSAHQSVKKTNNYSCIFGFKIGYWNLNFIFLLIGHEV